MATSAHGHYGRCGRWYGRPCDCGRSGPGTDSLAPERLAQADPKPTDREGPE